jgi:hypothetical protein
MLSTLSKVVVSLLLLCLPVKAADNALKMGYNFVTISQTVVFNNAMRAGGTFTLSTQAMDGGGRGPGDPFTIKMVFYNSSNAIINTAQLSNTLVYGATTPTTYTTTTTNCGGSCANVAYVKVEFYGKDGGYWAGNYGPYIQSPSLTFNGGSNILYNPDFGIYSGTQPHGWTSTNGWQSCQLYSGTNTCIINNNATVNSLGGGYSSTGGTTSGQAGGYSTVVVILSAITSTQQNLVNTSKSISGSGIYVNQSGTGVILNITQQGINNLIKGQDLSAAAQITGNYNSLTVNQNTSGNVLGIDVNGSYNTIGITQNKNQTALIGITGNSNNLTMEQQIFGASGEHFAKINISGNSNTIDTSQKDSGNKILFTDIQGSNNAVDVKQWGTGQHFLDLTLGSSNTVNVIQDGLGSHSATVNLSGNPTTLNLTQDASTNKNYYLQQLCTSATCSATVTQQ